MNKERRLGRGLEALLGRPPESPSTESHSLAAERTASPAPIADAAPQQVSVHEIDRNPFQPRREFDQAELNQLASSLREHGMLQPLLVRRAASGRFQLIAGERRLRAALQAGWNAVPVQIREADDRQMTEIAIVENLQRKDLHALEKAASFQAYLAKYGVSQEDLARRLQVDRSTIANLIRLLELPDTVQSSLRHGAITPGHARALLPLGDEQEQVAFAQRIEREGWNVRQTEEAVQQHIHRADVEPLATAGAAPASAPSVTSISRGRRKPKSDHLVQLERQLRLAVGHRVEIRQAASGRGRLMIHFRNHEEFEAVRRYLLSGSAEQPPVRRAG